MDRTRFAQTSSLVGREVETQLFDNMLAACVGGTGSCLVVDGRAGIGKSRLLTAAAALATRHGVAVAEGFGNPLDRLAPLTTLMTVLESPALTNIGAKVRDEVADNHQLAVICRIGEALDEFASKQPLMILLDDAHWADELSALALRVLTSMLESSPVVWGLTRRRAPIDLPAQSVLAALAARTPHHLRLQPLTAPMVTELAAATLGFDGSSYLWWVPRS